MKDSEQIYHQCSFLRKSENNVLLLLTWSSIVHDQPLQVLSEWASSVDDLKLYQQLVEDLWNSQRIKQLALILAVLMCHQRLLSYTLNDTAQLVKDDYLTDLNFLLNDQLFSNSRMIFERMSFSFLRVLDIFENEYKNMIQLLVVSVDKKALLLKWFDEFSDQYWARRVRDRLAHSRVYEEEKALILIEISTTSDINDGQKWFLIAFDDDLEENERCDMIEKVEEDDDTELTMM